MPLLLCLFQSFEVHSSLAEEVFPPGTKDGFLFVTQ